MRDPVDPAIAYAQEVVADFRRVVMEGWFGKHFEQPDRPPSPDRDVAERDIHGNDHDHGIDR